MAPESFPNVATLIAAENPLGGMFSESMDRLRAAGIEPQAGDWLAPEKVRDIVFSGAIAAARAALSDLEGQIDIAVQPIEHRRKMLLVSDMDSTMITVECIDELADYAGIKAQIATVTERAMEGELDFAEALRARVALLAGLDETVIETCLAERVRMMPGAAILVGTMRGWGAHSLLVSGGFTRFAEPVAARIGFAGSKANILNIVDGKLTGQVCGAIVDADAKKAALLFERNRLGLSIGQTLAVGDGANDIPMIEAAGFGVAYHAKPKVEQAAHFSIRHTDLTALLYAQGVAQTEWVANAI
jgi:phosphoserine phosphatase